MQACLEMIPADTRRVLVAYSGGLDSSVLLHLLVKTQPDYLIVPWHINHGLLEVADRMESFCVEHARSYGLETQVDRLDLSAVDRNIEAEARTQRYRLFERNSGAGDCILTAHHADDQAETFLLNALRGSGSAGLRGIAQRRRIGPAWLLRPLLRISRADLELYAAEHEISWFNDPSNQQLRFDRNYLRREVTPLLRQRWPNFQDSLSTASELQAETQALLDEVAAEDLNRLRREDYDGHATLDVPGLIGLGEARRHNLIRYWTVGGGASVLSQARMLELDRQLHARPDGCPEVAMPDYAIRLYDRRLFLVRDEAPRECSLAYEFGLSAEIEIEPLELKTRRSEILKRLNIPDRDQPLTLKFRRQGQQSHDRHRLKRLFQKHRVPPWRRDAVAQVYLDGELAGILS